MSRFNAYWVPCTPDWVATHNACGTTVRRPVLEPCSIGDDACGEEGHFHTVGHEHLMAMPGISPFTVPVDEQKQ
jgi:hypothetical protein